MSKVAALVFLIIPFIFPEASYAHAFGQQYNLPIPVWIFLYGGAAAVAASFVVIGLFVGDKSKNAPDYPTRIVLNWLSKLILSKWVKAFLQLGSFLLLLLLIASGHLGSNDATSNIGPTLFWVVFLLGFTYVTAIFGNIWKSVNPYQAYLDAWQVLTKTKIEPILNYPQKLSYWPALVFYFLLIWNELLSGGRAAQPEYLSNLVAIYSIITMIGVFVFGSVWLEKGELFSVFFGFVSKISIFEVRERVLTLRPPFVGLLEGSAEHISQILFIVFMLASTAFDGFRGTSVWFNLEFNAWNSLQDVVLLSNFITLETISLILAPVIFFTLYLAFIFIMKALTPTKLSTWQLAKSFAFSLIPIAVVYNVAHYFGLLLTQGQIFIALLSDPFGRGWNLFGTAGLLVNPSPLRADYIWYLQVFFIVSGHIAAIYIAHLIAVRMFPKYRQAVISQIPMLFLMVCYTLTGLWILSQPFNNKF